jgi:hypothetical protein
MREAPELERVKREDVETKMDESKEIAGEITPDTLSGATGGSRVETQEAREENVTKLREDAIKAADTAQIANDAPAEFAPAQTSELPPGTPVVFQKLPGIHAQVKELMDSINGDVKGIKKFTSFFTRGYNKDVLELATKGANKIANDSKKMEIYGKAIEQGGPELAWEYVNRTSNENFLDVENGEIIDRAIKKSTEFRGSSFE